MVVSDKEAFRILGLPLGVDRDAIQTKYKELSNRFAIGKSNEDKKKLEQVTVAIQQLLPDYYKNITAMAQQQANGAKNKSRNSRRICPVIEVNDSSSDDDKKGNCFINGVYREETESEKERKRAEKRRAKKKKRKDKRKLEKEAPVIPQNDTKSTPIVNNPVLDSDSESDEVEEGQGIDPNSAFVVKVGRKIRSNGTVPGCNGTANGNNKADEHKKSNKKNNTSQENEKNNVVLLESRQIQARQLAIQGNEEANRGQYDRAVRLFSEAIRLDPNDHRFFGNRSYCYDQLGQFDKALKDSEKAIKISPEWPKGHFRKGRALRGLVNLLEAEKSFEQVLKYDPGCEDAISEINKVRKRRIVEMGFTEVQARAAIKKHSHVQPALDALLSGEFKNSLENIYYSDEDEETIEEEEEEVRIVQQQQQAQPKSVKMNPRNPEGLTSLWVGNVVPEVTEKTLIKLFQKYGHVTSVRQLKEKYCAFVNFSEKAAAGRAMERLQGHELNGSRLLIKFPDNPIVNGTQNIIIRKNKGHSGKST